MFASGDENPHLPFRGMEIEFGRIRDVFCAPAEPFEGGSKSRRVKGKIEFT